MCSAPVDLHNLREMTDNDKNLERLLFQEFFSSAEKCIAVLEASGEDGASEEWRGGAHALKGISANLGAERLSEYSFRAQEGKGESKAAKESMLKDIKNEYEKVKIYLQEQMS